MGYKERLEKGLLCFCSFGGFSDMRMRHGWNRTDSSQWPQLEAAPDKSAESGPPDRSANPEKNRRRVQPGLNLISELCPHKQINAYYFKPLSVGFCALLHQ